MSSLVKTTDDARMEWNDVKEEKKKGEAQAALLAVRDSTPTNCILASSFPGVFFSQSVY